MPPDEKKYGRDTYLIINPDVRAKHRVQIVEALPAGNGGWIEPYSDNWPPNAPHFLRHNQVEGIEGRDQKFVDEIESRVKKQMDECAKKQKRRR